MNPLPRFLLYWAAAPAVLLGICLQYVAQVPQSTLTLQVTAAALASLVFVVLVTSRSLKVPGDADWLIPVLTLSLFGPLLTNAQSGPERWLLLGGVRLYIAPIVLPATLFLLGVRLISAPVLCALSAIAGAVTLALQPDASQASAFALGMLALAVSGTQLMLRSALLVILLSCSALAWHMPDPLMPVRHVEGIFILAAELSPFAFTTALMSATLPVAALIWVAWIRCSSGAFAVAAYYAALFVQAPLQVTPVPLLGFGAGPILGYFLVAGMIAMDSPKSKEVDR